jgi:transposase
MGKPYSLDLRERIIGFVGSGKSRREAADRFGVSPSCAIKLVDRWDHTGSPTRKRRLSTAHARNGRSPRT